MKRTPIPKRRKPRRGPMRCVKYRLWLRNKLCAVTSFERKDCHYFTGESTDDVFMPSDAAHTKNNGMGSKGPDSSCSPLCRKHHREYDSGRKAFEKKYGVDMKKIAAEHYARFLEETHS